jgi:hypothetical protein
MTVHACTAASTPSQPSPRKSLIDGFPLIPTHPALRAAFPAFAEKGGRLAGRGTSIATGALSAVLGDRNLCRENAFLHDAAGLA